MSYFLRLFVHVQMAAVVVMLAVLHAAAQSSASSPKADQALAAQSTSKSTPHAIARISPSYGKLPISFESNQGQTDKMVQFLARGAGYTLFLSPGEAVLSLRGLNPRSSSPAGMARSPLLRPAAVKNQALVPSDTVRMQLIGSNSRAEAMGVDPLPGKSNYFIGNDPAKWHTDVPTYAKVRYRSIYPGIDLVYYGNQEGRLEHDFVVAPGADPSAIVLSMSAYQDSVIPENGGLTLHTKTGDLTLCSPVVYQEIEGKRRPIPTTYALSGNNQIRFKLGSYDRNAPLVIDPVLLYSGAFGGSTEQFAVAIALDSAGNSYIAGYTNSTDFPLVDAFEGSASQAYSAFVAKINASGTALVYSTYLDCEEASNACQGSTTPSGIAVDSTGRAYVAGETYGTGFPVKNAYQPVGGNDPYAFLTVFGPAGDSLVYSTYLGGPGGSSANAIAVDASANAYITGGSGPDFPTLHSVQAQGDVFVAKFDSAGALQYSSILTGASADPTGIAVDAAGSAYITGFTSSTTYPTVQSAFQSTCRACPNYNGFVTKVSPSGESLMYSTYLGGAQANFAYAIAVDTSGQAYIGGVTGAGFPVTEHAFQKSFGGDATDSYITKLNATGSGLIYSTYLGGSGNDSIYAMALDQYRQVYVTGTTTSPNFPQKASMQGWEAPSQNYVTTLSNAGSSIVYYSTYFGSAASYETTGIAVDKALNIYLTGAAFSGGIVPITPGALDISNGGNEVFVSKLVIEDDLSLALSSTPAVHGREMSYTIAVTSKGPDFGYNVQVADTLPAGTTFVSYGAGGGTCTAPAVGSAGVLNCQLQQLNKGNTWRVTLTVQVNAGSGTKLSDTAVAISNTQDFTPGNNQGTLTTSVH